MPSSALLLSTFLLGTPLLGPGVGNPDLLATEGVRFYNQKQYTKAADTLSRAIRANPAVLGPYLTLARSLMAARRTARACQVYKAYLKSASDSLDRSKAQSEMELCDRQLKASGKKPADNTAQMAELKHQLYASLDEGKLVGPDSAALALQALLDTGYLGVDLAEMANKLHTAAQSAADNLHQRALAHEKLTPNILRTGPSLYALAADTGTPPPSGEARSAFLIGLALLSEGNPKDAQAKFGDAAQADPATKDYLFYRALAIYQGGDRSAALRQLESDLPGDGRTATLRAELALGNSPQTGADELERALFSQRFAK